MSLLNEVQKFIEAHPGCTSGDIADAFAGYSRQRVLQSASKLRQSGRVAHRCEGDIPEGKVEITISKYEKTAGAAA